MRTVLEAISEHPKLQLQLVVTGMHLDERHGRSIRQIRQDGWEIDAVVPWKAAHDPVSQSRQTGTAMAALAGTFNRLKSDIVLVTGDRVEPFAAAAAGYLSGLMVAHIHGGDRAAGQVDDSLRHAITRLAHLHFPATAGSARRLIRMGEEPSRVYLAGAPGIDGIVAAAAPRQEIRERFASLVPGRFGMIVLHPLDASVQAEHTRAELVINAMRGAGIEQLVVVYPNSDPGASGTIRCWEEQRRRISYLLKNLPRREFLGLLRDAAMLAGNSSSGIIEAASFGTPVIDIGPRQQGRERSENVRNVPYKLAAIQSAAASIWNGGKPRRWRGRNVYGGQETGLRIAQVLGSQDLRDYRLSHKLIAY